MKKLTNEDIMTDIVNNLTDDILSGKIQIKDSPQGRYAELNREQTLFVIRNESAFVQENVMKKFDELNKNK